MYKRRILDETTSERWSFIMFGNMQPLASECWIGIKDVLWLKVHRQVYRQKLNLELWTEELEHKAIILHILTDVKNTTLHTVTDDAGPFIQFPPFPYKKKCKNVKWGVGKWVLPSWLPTKFFLGLYMPTERHKLLPWVVHQKREIVPTLLIDLFQIVSNDRVFNLKKVY